MDRTRTTIILVLGLAAVLLVLPGPTNPATSDDQAEARSLSPAFGFLDSVNGSTSNIVNVPWGWLNTVQVKGWAATSDFPTTALGVRVVINGSDYYFPNTNYRLANRWRPDVGAAYPGYGNYHGFDFRVPVPTGSGHELCVEAQNSGVYNQIGSCRTLFVTGNPGNEMRFTGGLWQQTPYQNLTLHFTRPTTWRADVDASAQTWDSHSRINFAPTTSSSGIEVRVLVFNFGTGRDQTLGSTKYAPWCTALDDGCGTRPRSNRIFTDNRVLLNRESSYITTRSGWQAYRNKTIAHEFGHVLGLQHPTSPGVLTVMDQGRPGANNISEVPENWDFESVSMAYT